LEHVRCRRYVGEGSQIYQWAIVSRRVVVVIPENVSRRGNIHVSAEDSHCEQERDGKSDQRAWKTTGMYSMYVEQACWGRLHARDMGVNLGVGNAILLSFRASSRVEGEQFQTETRLIPGGTNKARQLTSLSQTSEALISPGSLHYTHTGLELAFPVTRRGVWRMTWHNQH